MPEVTEDLESEGSRVVLDKDTTVFQRIRPESPSMFVVGQRPVGTKVKIGGPEEVVLYTYDDLRQLFVPWVDSGEKKPQYFKLADLPPMARLALSPVSDGAVDN